MGGCDGAQPCLARHGKGERARARAGAGAKSFDGVRLRQQFSPTLLTSDLAAGRGKVKGWEGGEVHLLEPSD